MPKQSPFQLLSKSTRDGGSEKNSTDWATRPREDEFGEALRAELLGWPGVEARKMMGTLAFFRGKTMLGCYVNREMFQKTPPAWANRAGEPPLVWVRLNAEEKRRALRRAGVSESRANPMKTWVEIPLDSHAAVEEAVRWLGVAYEARPRGKIRANAHRRGREGRRAKKKS